MKDNKRYLYLLLLLGVLTVLSFAQVPAVQSSAAYTHPPTFVEQPPLDSVFIIGEAVKLPCKAKAEPPPDYKWFKNGKEFNWAANAGRYTKWPDEGTLIVARPHMDDDGMYQCVAMNNLGTAYSIITNLRRGELSDFDKAGTQLTERVALGNSVVLPCSIPNSYPPPVVRWAVTNEGVRQYIKETNRRAIDIFGNLYIANVIQEDNNLVYTCTANNVVLRKEKTGPGYRIQVTGTSPLQKRVEELYRTPRRMVGVVNETQRIKCIFSGQPTPKIVWEKLNSPVLVAAKPNIKIENAGTELQINPVTADSEGEYQCMGSNEVSSEVVYIIVKLEVYSKPTFVQQPVDTTVPLLGSHVFHCEAKGFPKPQIKWTVNGKAPSAYLDGSRKVMRGDSIYLYNLTSKDVAVFQCNATNSYGYAFADAYINVMRQPPVFERAPQIGLRMAEGQAAYINCQTFSAPKALIAWKKDGRPVSGGRYQIMENGDLYISRLITTDTGQYECTATNIYGTATAQGDLTVRQRTQIKVPPIDTRIYENSEVKMVCTAATDPLEQQNLIIVWSKDNNPIDFEENPRVRTLAQDNSLIISGAQPRDTGQYTCKATNGLDFDEATASLVVQGRPEQPTQVTADCMKSISQRIAIVNWNPGADNYAPIIDYIIEYSTQFEPDTWYIAVIKNETNGGKGDASATNKGDATAASVVLRPHINYKFRVRAKNRVGISEHSVPTYTSCLVASDIPDSNPRELYVYGTKPHNLIIRWTPMTYPEHNAGNLGYELTVRCLNCDQIPVGDLNTTFVGEWRQDRVEYDMFRVSTVSAREIETYKQFEVSIRAKNDKGESSMAPLKVKGYSGEDVPRVNPTPATVLSSASSTAALKWTIIQQADLAEMRGFFRGYRIEWCLASMSAEECELKKRYQDEILRNPTTPIWFGKKRRRRSVSSGPAALRIQKRLQRRRRWTSDANVALQRFRRQTATINFGGEYTAILEGLPGSQTIKIWTRIINSQYASAPSPPVMVTTSEGFSGPVSEFRVVIIGVNHVELRWARPPQPNGNLTGYQFGVREIDQLNLGYLTRYPVINEADKISGKVSGLKPSSTYRVYIWPVTGRGNGVDSFIDVVTAPVDSAPSTPTFAVIAVGTKDLNVTFEPSRTGITGSVFFVQYRVPGRERWEETRREFTNHWIFVVNLLSDTEYEVRVVATNGAGMTTPSSVKRVRTGGPERTAKMKGASATWFIILFFIVLLLIGAFILLVCLRKKRLAQLKGKAVPTEEPPLGYGGQQMMAEPFPPSGGPGGSMMSRPATAPYPDEQYPPQEKEPYDPDREEYGAAKPRYRQDPPSDLGSGIENDPPPYSAHARRPMAPPPRPAPRQQQPYYQNTPGDRYQNVPGEQQPPSAGSSGYAAYPPQQPPASTFI